jgi:hypothetical protein
VKSNFLITHNDLSISPPITGLHHWVFPKALDLPIPRPVLKPWLGVERSFLLFPV